MKPDRKLLAMLALLAAGALVSGCASITTGTTHLIYVETTYKGEDARGATCELQSSAGRVELKTPGSATVQRTGSDLMIQCDCEGLPRGTAVARSRVRGMLFGNIIFGGGVGAIIDAASGAAYQYPQRVVVRLGESIVVEPEEYQAEIDRQNAEKAGPGTGSREPAPTAAPPAVPAAGATSAPAAR